MRVFSAQRFKQIEAFVCLLSAFHSLHRNETSQVHLPPYQLVQAVCNWASWEETKTLSFFSFSSFEMNIFVQIILWRWKYLKNGYGSKYIAEKSREKLRLFLCLCEGEFKQKHTRVPESTLNW